MLKKAPKQKKTNQQSCKVFFQQLLHLSTSNAAAFLIIGHLCESSTAGGNSPSPTPHHRRQDGAPPWHHRITVATFVVVSCRRSKRQRVSSPCLASRRSKHCRVNGLGWVVVFFLPPKLGQKMTAFLEDKAS